MNYKVRKVLTTYFSVFEKGDSLWQVVFIKNVCRLRKRGTDISVGEGC